MNDFNLEYKFQDKQNMEVANGFHKGDRVMVTDKDSPVYGKFGFIIKESKHRAYKQTLYRVDLDGRRVISDRDMKKVPNSVQFIIGN